MFFSPYILLLALLSVIEVTAAQSYDLRPLVESNRLRRILTRKDLLKQAETLQSFANAPNAGGNRGFGGPGHNATINYIYDTISKLDQYYNVYFQPFTESYSAAKGTFTVENDNVVFYPARGSPSVDELRAGLIGVRAGGCNIVSIAP
jgi:hypothetical protein